MNARIFTNGEKLRAVERELGYRRRVFAQRVSNGKMSQTLANEQIALFEAIATDYRALAEKERLI